MTRKELTSFIERECQQIINLFEKKNSSYGAEHNAFHNFIEAARRVLWVNVSENYWNPDDVLRTLLIYINKHMIALENRGMQDPEAQERFRDIAVYALIGAALIAEFSFNNATLILNSDHK
jgi:hypothetical protein